MDRSGHFIQGDKRTFPHSVADWYKAQVRHEMQFLNEDMEPIITRVDVKMPLSNGRGFSVCGEGDLWLDSKGWNFSGKLFDKNTQLFFPIDTVPAVPFDPNDNLQICSKGSFYLFCLRDNPRATAKFATIGECAYWRFASRIQMTPGKDSGFCEE